jgi:hypothetical protein
LPNLESARMAGKVKAQVRFELGDVKFFAGSNGRRMVKHVDLKISR